MAAFPKTEQTRKIYVRLQRYNLVIKLVLGAAGNIACCGHGQVERVNIVIELFVIYKALLIIRHIYNVSFWCSDEISQ